MFKSIARMINRRRYPLLLCILRHVAAGSIRSALAIHTLPEMREVIIALEAGETDLDSAFDACVRIGKRI